MAFLQIFGITLGVIVGFVVVLWMIIKSIEFVISLFPTKYQDHATVGSFVVVLSLLISLLIYLIGFIR